MSDKAKSVIVDAILLADFMWSIYDRMKQSGVEFTPDNIRAHIAGLKARAEVNNLELGIDTES